MFDPMTVAFVLGDITIWHKDPCSNGTDNSCRNSLLRKRWHVWHWRIHSRRIAGHWRWVFERCRACNTPMRYAIYPQRFMSGTVLCRPGCWKDAEIARKDKASFDAAVTERAQGEAGK